VIRLIENECYHCKNKRNNPGDCHIRCSKPDRTMTGAVHGIRNGWFFYPFNFDPCWKTKLCDNFEEVVK